MSERLPADGTRVLCYLPSNRVYLPGKTGAMFQQGMGAKPIHEKAGASVTILRDRLNRMHYLVQFDSWEAHAKFSDTPNPEFAEYMQKVSADPSAELVKTYLGFELQP